MVATRTVRARAASTCGAGLAEYLAVLVLGLVAIVAASGYAQFGEALDSMTRFLAAKVERLEGATPGNASGSGLASAAGGSGGAGGGSTTHGRTSGGAGASPGTSVLASAPGCARSASGQTVCADGMSCFVAGTPVATPDGPRAIDQIRVGDAVLARDEETGDVVSRRGLRTFVTPDSPLVALTLTARSGAAEAVYATPGHLFWTAHDEWALGSMLETVKPGYATATGAEADRVRRQIAKTEARLLGDTPPAPSERAYADARAALDAPIRVVPPNPSDPNLHAERRIAQQVVVDQGLNLASPEGRAAAKNALDQVPVDGVKRPCTSCFNELYGGRLEADDPARPPASRPRQRPGPVFNSPHALGTDKMTPELAAEINASVGPGTYVTLSSPAGPSTTMYGSDSDSDAEPTGCN